jgi:hypothetical protein
MKVGIKIMRQENGVQRVYLSEIEDAQSSKEVLTEVNRGRQAVGNYNESIAMRCGDDQNFFSLNSKVEITDWIDERLKKK